MKGANKLIQEIKAQHYRNTAGLAIVDEEIEQMSADTSEVPKKRKRRTKAEMAMARQSQETEAPMQVKPVKSVEKQPRIKRAKPVSEYTDEHKDLNMFTVTVVGGIGLPGYPLNKGEKLAIVKLTPIAFGK